MGYLHLGGYNNIAGTTKQFTFGYPHNITFNNVLTYKEAISAYYMADNGIDYPINHSDLEGVKIRYGWGVYSNRDNEILNCALSAATNDSNFTSLNFTYDSTKSFYWSDEIDIGPSGDMKYSHILWEPLQHFIKLGQFYTLVGLDNTYWIAISSNLFGDWHSYVMRPYFPRNNIKPDNFGGNSFYSVFCQFNGNELQVPDSERDKTKREYVIKANVVAVTGYDSTTNLGASGLRSMVNFDISQYYDISGNVSGYARWLGFQYYPIEIELEGYNPYGCFQTIRSPIHGIKHNVLDTPYVEPYSLFCPFEIVYTVDQYFLPQSASTRNFYLSCYVFDSDLVTGAPNYSYNQSYENPPGTPQPLSALYFPHQPGNVALEISDPNTGTPYVTTWNALNDNQNFYIEPSSISYKQVNVLAKIDRDSKTLTLNSSGVNNLVYTDLNGIYYRWGYMPIYPMYSDTSNFTNFRNFNFIFSNDNSNFHWTDEINAANNDSYLLQLQSGELNQAYTICLSTNVLSNKTNSDKTYYSYYPSYKIDLNDNTKGLFKFTDIQWLDSKTAEITGGLFGITEDEFGNAYIHNLNTSSVDKAVGVVYTPSFPVEFGCNMDFYSVDNVGNRNKVILNSFVTPIVTLNPLVIRFSLDEYTYPQTKPDLRKFLLNAKLYYNEKDIFNYNFSEVTQEWDLYNSDKNEAILPNIRYHYEDTKNATNNVLHVWRSLEDTGDIYFSDSDPDNIVISSSISDIVSGYFDFYVNGYLYKTLNHSFSSTTIKLETYESTDFEIQMKYRDVEFNARPGLKYYNASPVLNLHIIDYWPTFNYKILPEKVYRTNTEAPPSGDYIYADETTTNGVCAFGFGHTETFSLNLTSTPRTFSNEVTATIDYNYFEDKGGIYSLCKDNTYLYAGTSIIQPTETTFTLGSLYKKPLNTTNNDWQDLKSEIIAGGGNLDAVFDVKIIYNTIKNISATVVVGCGLSHGVVFIKKSNLSYWTQIDFQRFNSISSFVSISPPPIISCDIKNIITSDGIRRVLLILGTGRQSVPNLDKGVYFVTLLESDLTYDIPYRDYPSSSTWIGEKYFNYIRNDYSNYPSISSILSNTDYDLNFGLTLIDIPNYQFGMLFSNYNYSLSTNNSRIIKGKIKDIFKTGPMYQEYTTVFTAPNQSGITKILKVTNDIILTTLHNPAKLYRSVDSGDTWQQIELGLSGSDNIYCISYLPDNDMVIIGLNATTLLVSLDKGLTWDKIYKSGIDDIPISIIETLNREFFIGTYNFQ